jgi:hypothetical protein
VALSGTGVVPTPLMPSPATPLDQVVKQLYMWGDPRLTANAPLFQGGSAAHQAVVHRVRPGGRPSAFK